MLMNGRMGTPPSKQNSIRANIRNPENARGARQARDAYPRDTVVSEMGTNQRRIMTVSVG
jgi:hypothetical protein